MRRKSAVMRASGHNGDIQRAAHGYDRREAAMAALAKSWRWNRHDRAAVDHGCRPACAETRCGNERS